jgi:hypothetical protein
MKRRFVRVVAMLLAVVMLSTSAPAPARAQAYDYLVYDESNWWEAVAQVSALVQQILHMIRQARRLPFDMLARYHGHSIDWTFHDLESGLLYAQRILDALNQGDPTRTAYRQIVDRLDLPTGAVDRMPSSLQERFKTAYAGVELADSVASLAVGQLGALRVDGPHNLQVAKNMEKDAVSTDGDLHTQISVLNKINTAAVLGLRYQDHMTQALLGSLEQILVSNRRQRDAEALVLNATIHQWRYGQDYGDSLFQNTARNIDNWRLR